MQNPSVAARRTQGVSFPAGEIHLSVRFHVRAWSDESLTLVVRSRPGPLRLTPVAFSCGQRPRNRFTGIEPAGERLSHGVPIREHVFRGNDRIL